MRQKDGSRDDMQHALKQFIHTEYVNKPTFTRLNLKPFKVFKVSNGCVSALRPYNPILCNIQNTQSIKEIAALESIVKAKGLVIHHDMVCSQWSWFRGRFVVTFSSGERFVNKFPPPSLLRNNHGLRKLAQTSLQRLSGIMAGRVSISLLNSLAKGNVIFRNKKCLRRSVVLVTRCHARSLSSSSISAVQPDLSSHLAGKTYADLYELSIRDPETFWGSIAKERLAWNKPFDQVTDCDLSSGKINWFLGGQLNVSGECHTFFTTILLKNLHWPICYINHLYLSEQKVMSIF